MLTSERQDRTETLSRLAKMADSTSEDQKVIDKIDKLFKKAAHGATQEEAAAFMAKANELMEAHGLSMSAINEGSSTQKASKRTDEKLKGGLYQFQRDLWKAVAELNFCWYFNLYERDYEKVSKYWVKKYGGIANVPEYRKGGYVFRHRLVGRAVNVAATISMCGYLEQTVERIVRERLEVRNLAKGPVDQRGDVWSDKHEDWVKEQDDTLWGEWGVKFREGIVDTVVEKLTDRRRDLLRQELVKQREAQRAAAGEAGAKFATGTALTLGTLTEQENAENFDFVYGEGEYAKMMAERAARAERQRLAAERYAKWAKDHPEEAKAQEEERRKEARRYGHTPWNAGTGKSKYDSGAYHDGRRAGEKVSLDQQMGGGVKGLLK